MEKRERCGEEMRVEAPAPSSRTLFQRQHRDEARVSSSQECASVSSWPISKIKSQRKGKIGLKHAIYQEVVSTGDFSGFDPCLAHRNDRRTESILSFSSLALSIAGACIIIYLLFGGTLMLLRWWVAILKHGVSAPAVCKYIVDRLQEISSYISTLLLLLSGDQIEEDKVALAPGTGTGTKRKGHNVCI